MATKVLKQAAHLLWVAVKVPVRITVNVIIMARAVLVRIAALDLLLWAVVKVVLVRMRVIVDVRNNVVGSGCVRKMEQIMYMVFLAAVGNGSALLFLQMALKLVLALVRRSLRIVNGSCPALPICRHRVRNVFGIWIAQIQPMMNAGR